ncbi:MAG TPA: hypothetical protein PLP29_07065 [Candidatus Ozemobacteraceae bacterium]|nr:hypothetical protein [Candidatus Ozemobacteraceae bacterium]
MLIVEHSASGRENVGLKYRRKAGSNHMGIFLLEDSETRIRQFADLGLDIAVRNDAFEAVAYLHSHRTMIQLLSLDHDLQPHETPCGNLGIACGCFVVDFLNLLAPFCPVMIHTSNEVGALVMKQRLARHGWNVIWVKSELLYPDDWIQTIWKDRALEALGIK